MKKFNISYMILIFIVSFNLRLGISSVPPIQEMIQESLDLSNLQISLLTGIPVICMGIFAFLVGKVQRKFGIQKSIYYFLILLGAMTLGRILSFNYVILLITTFGIGFSIAIIGPLLSGFIKEEFPKHTSIMVAIFSFGMGTGSLLVSKVTKGIALKTGDNWAFALAIWGVFAIIACFVWKKYAGVTENVMDEIRVKVNYLDINIWKMIFFFGIQSGIFYSFSMYLIPFLKDEGIREEALISLLTLFVAAQMISGFLIPVIMHKIGTIRHWSIFSSIFLSLGLILPVILNMSVFLAIIIIVFLAIGLGGSFPIAMLMPLEYSHNSNEATVISGVVQAFGYIIGGIIPIIFGMIIDITNNYSWIFYAMILGSFAIVYIGISGVHSGKRK